MLLILGDPHIGKGLPMGKSGLGTALNSRIVDQLNILDWVIEQATKLNVSDIIITGDVFEEPKPHPTIITLFLSWLKRCESHNIKVHIIVGNHDILRSGSFMISALDIISEADLSNINVYKTLSTIYIDNVGITLIPFRDRRSFNVDSNATALEILAQNIAFEQAEIPTHYHKVVIGHLAIVGSIPVGDEIDDITNELYCPLNMFSGYDYVWMGHVHKPQVLSKAPRIAHIGSMDLSDFGETDHTKIVILFDPQKPNRFEEIEIPTRPLKKITISVPENTKDTTKFVNDIINEKYSSLDKAIIKLEINLTSPNLLSVDRNAIEKNIYKLKAFHICKFSESKKIAMIKKKDETKENIDMAMNENTAIKLYAETYIDENMKDAFINVAQDIVAQYKTENKD